RGEDDHIHGDSPHHPDQGIFHPDHELPFLFGSYGPVSYLRHTPSYELDPFIQELVVELLVALAGGAHIDVEVIDLGARVVLHHMGQLQGVHAADTGAPAVRLLVAGAHAVDDRHAFRMGAVPKD